MPRASAGAGAMTVVAPIAATVANTASVFFMRIPPLPTDSQREAAAMVAAGTEDEIQVRLEPKKRAARGPLFLYPSTWKRLTDRDASGHQSRDRYRSRDRMSDNAAHSTTR